MQQDPPSFIEGYRPGFLGRIAEMHGVYYAKVWGSGETFEGMMACELHEFLQAYEHGRDFLLTAHVDGRMVGSIAVDGRQLKGIGGLLRWVLLEEGYHGRGIGKEMLIRSLDFCRSAGFSRVFLWTVEGLPESMGLYERFGFKVVQKTPGEHYSVPHVHLELELEL